MYLYIIHFVNSAQAVNLQCEKHDDANNINLQSSSLSHHSDEFSMVDDFQKQMPKNEYTRAQLLELRHDQTLDMVEKAKNMKIAERIIQKNAAKKLADPKTGPAKMAPAKIGIAAKDSQKEPNIDDFWSKATTSTRNAASQKDDDLAFEFDLPNPWAKPNFDEPTDFTFSNNAKVGNWLNAGRNEMPTQFSQSDDFPIEPSNQSNKPDERKRTDTSSLVSDVSMNSTLRSKLLDKTAKLKQTLINLKQPNN